MLVHIVMITFIAGVMGTGAGGFLGALFCRDSARLTGLMVSFAAGIMLSVVCFNMVEEAILPENAGRPMSILLVDAGIAVGFFMVWGLNEWIEKVRYAFAFSSGGYVGAKTGSAGDVSSGWSGNYRLLTAGIVMILAIAIHNLPEGMVIGASFAADSMGSAGLILAVVIGIHNIPEGMAVATALTGGGMDRFRTVLLTAASGFPTVIGAVIGWRLGTMGPVMLCLMLSFAAGAMLYVVMGELIPEALDMWNSRLIAVSILLGMLTGLIIIFA
ncbi:MAG: ZIP family metal transporter [Lachnospiraceae bacterium]|nr:ZIP family metal transporter [Lachnospiraceae bacterium]